MNLLLILFCKLIICAAMPCNKDDCELVLLQAITRHGKRTSYRFYPNDPYKNSTFYPMGSGGLLNEGKVSCFNVGERLRQEYGTFLGDTYANDVVYATSTDTPRTRMTAQLVLAGLFPPNKEQLWNPSLRWQPIPVFTKPGEHENVINCDCEYRRQRIESLKQNSEMNRRYYMPYKKLFQYIEENSGMKIDNLADLLEFYFIVNTEFEMGLEQPAWVMKIYPEELYEATKHVYAFQNSHEDAKKIHMGYLFKKIIEDSQEKSKDKLQQKQTKLYLYAGHESTIAWILTQLKATPAHIPPYSSTLVFETYKNGRDEYYIKVRYMKGPSKKLDVLQIPNCEVMCPLDKFRNLNEDAIPHLTLEQACKGTSSHLSVH